MRQLQGAAFAAAVSSGDAPAAASAAVKELEPAVTAAMANIERASAGAGAPPLCIVVAAKFTRI